MEEERVKSGNGKLRFRDGRKRKVAGGGGMVVLVVVKRENKERRRERRTWFCFQALGGISVLSDTSWFWTPTSLFLQIRPDPILWPQFKNNYTKINVILKAI